MLEVRDLSKLYRLGTIGAGTLRESISRGWDRFRGRKHLVHHGGEAHAEIDPDRMGPEPNTFWALKDINFSVKEGEVVGIIGRNGAGKSTLLKILSRITEPTSGEIVLHGRVASLLEVGTGFHPELTGRENVFLNGAILGMGKAEIAGKLDEIIDFSGVEKFIDTPVKRYSSGMAVRLAFSVAAHLDPEILVVDEVLAVGDAAFQEKCLKRLGTAAKGGKTVIFVSHNMGAVSSLCRRAIHIDNGILIADGPAETTVGDYLAPQTIAAKSDVSRFRIDQTGGELRFDLITLCNTENGTLPYQERLSFHFKISASSKIDSASVGLTVFSSSGTPVGNSFSKDLIALEKGESASYYLKLEQLSLAPGTYYCGIALVKCSASAKPRIYDLIKGHPRFTVMPFSSRGEAIGHWEHSNWGSILIRTEEFTKVD